MRRRQFIAAAGLGALGALAGCSGSESTPPPRKSNVVTDIEVNSGALVVDLTDDTWVMSRYDAPDRSLSDPNPVGVAAAQSKGGGGGAARGATGRGSGGYSSAPRTRHGFAWYHGGTYSDDWYDDHDDDVTRYSVAVAAIGVASLGSAAAMQSDAPEPGPVSWDETFEDPSDTVQYDVSDDGWYRVGANVVGENVDHDFRWECYDVELDGTGTGYDVEEQWKVSPRI